MAAPRSASSRQKAGGKAQGSPEAGLVRHHPHLEAAQRQNITGYALACDTNDLDFREVKWAVTFSRGGPNLCSPQLLHDLTLPHIFLQERSAGHLAEHQVNSLGSRSLHHLPSAQYVSKHSKYAKTSLMILSSFQQGLPTGLLI